MKSIVLFSLSAIGAGAIAMSAQSSDPMPNITEETSEEYADSLAQAMYGNLEEVTVTGVRPVVTSDGATTTYNVDDDPAAAGTTLLDLLRKVPMVSVDGDDNIRLKGESNYKILVNGMEDPNLSANASQLFKMMPATAVAKIEVITEPGAKYDAEGTGGIINLITIRQQKQDGYSGGAQLFVNNRMSGGHVNGTIKKGNVTIGANVDYANGRYNPSESRQIGEIMYMVPATGETRNFLDCSAMQKSKFDYVGSGLKFSWEPSASDLFTMDLNVNRVKGDVGDGYNRTTMHSAVRTPDGGWMYGDPIWTLWNRLDLSMTNLSTTALASYQHNFSGNRNFLTLSYQFSYGHNQINTLTEVEEIRNTVQVPVMTNDQLNINREQTVQLDYTNDFNSERHLLETGAKYIGRHNSGFGDMKVGENRNELYSVEDSRSNLTQLQDVLALYASYTGKYGNWNTKAGVRYEHTRMGNRYHIGNEQDFTNNLNDVVPNASVSYSFGPAQNLRIAYQMRISRPTMEQINPYMLYVDRDMMQCGNPNLKSEHNNNISISYSQYGNILGGNIGLEYTQTNNCIANYYTSDGDLLIRTYGNLGTKKGAAVNGYINWTIIPRMSLGLNARVEYIDFRSKSPDFSNHGWQGNFTATWNYMLLSGWNFGAYGGLSTRNLNLQGYWPAYHYYGISVNKQLLKDRSLTVGLSLNNFLESEIKYKSLATTNEIRNTSTSYNSNWNVGINVSWNFGNLNAEVKRTSNSIHNDDKSTAKGENMISTQ